MKLAAERESGSLQMNFVIQNLRATSIGIKYTWKQRKIEFFLNSPEMNFVTQNLRAPWPQYQLDVEVVKNGIFFKLTQNEALHALGTKILFCCAFQ